MKKNILAKIILSLLGLGLILSLGWIPVNQSYLREIAEFENIEKGFESFLKEKFSKKEHQKYQSKWEQLAKDDKSQGIVSIQCHPKSCGNRSLWFFKTKRWVDSKDAKKDKKSLFLGKVRLSKDKKNPLSDNYVLSFFENEKDTKALYATTVKTKLAKWTAILPPLFAIFFVLLTRKVLLSLFLSLFMGVLFLYDGNVGQALYHSTITYVWKKAFFKEFSFQIILFTLSLIGMINVCSRNGGVKGLIDLLTRFAKTAKTARLTTALMGVVIFFDDYANSIMVGNTMRPLTDKFRISREKLAYLVDSTAAPIAGVALLSTWIGYEVGLLGDLSKALDLPMNGYSLFLSSLSFRFYCWFSLIFVFMNILMNRDFGPMLKAERRAWEEGKVFSDTAQPMVQIALHKVEPPENAPARWYNAFIPIFTVLVVGFGGLMVDGGFFAGKSLQDALSNANNTKIFLIAAVTGSLVAIFLTIAQRIISLRDALEAWFSGAQAMFFAIGILVFAWAMGALAKDLGTAHYLIALLKGNIQAVWIPLLVFFMSSCIAFATGTSWGTMGILLPTAVPLAYQLGGLPIMILSIGAVLDGSIFGDHCSPLSDTTMFSSASTSCDHVDHVKTQAPYAFVVMFFASLAGYVLVSFQYPLWSSFLIAFVGFFLIFLLVGKESNPPLSSKEKK